MKKKDNGTTRMALLLMAGGIAGAACALLFAPQSGKKTRRDIQRARRNLVEHAEDFRHDLSERLEDLVEDSLDIANHGLDRGKKIGKKVCEDLLPTLQASKEVVSDQIERLNTLLQK